MLNAFQVKNKRVIRLDEKNEDLSTATWIDLIEPDEDDRQRVLTEFNQNLAASVELDDIEASARFFEDEDGLHVHSFFFYEDSDSHVGNSTVAFTINNGRLFTLRERDLPTFRLYRMRSRIQQVDEGNPYELLLDLFDTKVEQLADVIESIYNELEQLGVNIMQSVSEQNEYDDAISHLAEIEDRGWKIRLCLMDSQRALNFLVRRGRLPPLQLEQTREIIRDIESLIPHNESLFQKVNFLMQAALGFVNIAQNRIIKIFSVVSVIFLPPTVVASAYGMNFINMPELHWKYGYPAAIALMIIAAIAPYIYFKIKKWL